MQVLAVDDSRTMRDMLKLTLDEAGTSQSANPAARRIFGYRDDELLGRNIKMLMP